MEKFIINGSNRLKGEVTIGGAKNVALKIPVAALLTDEQIILHNVPHIKDVFFLIEVLQSLGAKANLKDHTLEIKLSRHSNLEVPLEVGARLRSSSLVLGPMLARFGEAKIPNPGGCRIGARPIDRHIAALIKMGAEIVYNSTDGFFYARAKKLHGETIHFPKNTHTGTETIILAAVLANGTTIIDNAAQEIEVDDLIACLNQMGAKVKRVGARQIVITGVTKLHGVEYTIMPDRNEEVTFATIAALCGDIIINKSQPKYIAAFLEAYQKAGGRYEQIDEETTRYKSIDKIKATDVQTGIYPGFMTDWQAPWSILMTQAQGKSTVHETVFESRFSYVSQLNKMGAKINFFDPPIDDPQAFYNFNWNDRIAGYHQAITISGPTKLHNAVVEIDDLRAGATLVIAALIACGESYIYGVEQIDRGYERIEDRLKALGAQILRVKEES